MTITIKVKSLFAMLKEKAECDAEFTAGLGGLNDLRIVIHYVM
jgi:hypothetical protein